jgi:2-oxoglutarate ferredoxin oxidoreductase subunit gamma
MTERIIIAGAGGQGIMLLGKVLALSAMREDKFVTWLPSYGAEVRGGAAYCMVTISDEEIGSPYIEEADILIAMNQPSLEKFKSRLRNKGLLVVNSSLAEIKIPGSKYFILKQPFSDIAAGLGNLKVANMVALGSYIKRSNVIKLNTVLSTIEELTPQDRKDLGEINKKALMKGAGITGDKL